MLRRLRSALRRVFSKPKAVLGIYLAVFVLLLGVGLVGSTTISPHPTSSPAASKGSGPAFTYAGTWSLLELQQHISAGEVIAISVPSEVAPTFGASVERPYLAAKLTSGQVMQVDLDVTSTEATIALRSMGYGGLITSDSLPLPPGPSNGFDFSNILTIMAVIGILVFVLWFMRRSQTPSAARTGSAGFQIIMPGGAGEPDPTRSPTVRMSDVAGLAEAKRDVAEVIDFLANPDKFTRLGARIPRGLLFFGPPGSGKTMLAKAIATESGVPCIIASGSQFTDTFVGVGARRVRELFSAARKMGRAVIFIDEFDSLAARRGSHGENSEDLRTINELLAQLDGFRTTDNVVVIAATNRIESLDEAAIRSGRFSRKIHMPLPDRSTRIEILAVHAKGKPLATDTDLKALARSTAGMSGADLADLLNEAAIGAARRDSETISSADLRSAWLRVAVGSGRQRSMPERERAIIAAHEAGHAIAGKVYSSHTRVEEISLFAHGMVTGEALGFTLSVPDDNALPRESDLWADLIRLFGGRAAEQLVFCEVTGGAANDFEQANKIASVMVTRFGMGTDPDDELSGPSGRGSRLSLRISNEGSKVSPATAEAMERAIVDILERAYEKALSALRDHMFELEAVCGYLFDRERMDGDEFEAIWTKALLVPETAVAAWRGARDDLPVPIFGQALPMSPASPRPAAQDQKRDPLKLKKPARGRFGFWPSATRRWAGTVESIAAGIGERAARAKTRRSDLD